MFYDNVSYPRSPILFLKLMWLPADFREKKESRITEFD